MNFAVGRSYFAGVDGMNWGLQMISMHCELHVVVVVVVVVGYLLYSCIFTLFFFLLRL